MRFILREGLPFVVEEDHQVRPNDAIVIAGGWARSADWPSDMWGTLQNLNRNTFEEAVRNFCLAGYQVELERAGVNWQRVLGREQPNIFEAQNIQMHQMRPARRANPARYHKDEFKPWPCINEDFGICQRSVKFQPFKLNYELLEEAQLRLSSSIFLLNGQPVYCKEVQGRDGEDYTIIIQDAEGENYHLKYSQVNDLRSIEPGYITLGGRSYYLSRKPTRVMKQGLTHDNMSLISVGNKGMDRGADFDSRSVMKALKNRRNILWTKEYQNLLQRDILSSIRLNNNLCVYFDTDEKEIVTEYKIRELGVLHDDLVSVDPEDFNVPWIVASLNTAGLRQSLSEGE